MVILIRETKPHVKLVSNVQWYTILLLVCVHVFYVNADDDKFFGWSLTLVSYLHTNTHRTCLFWTVKFNFSPFANECSATKGINLTKNVAKWELQNEIKLWIVKIASRWKQLTNNIVVNNNLVINNLGQ